MDELDFGDLDFWRLCDELSIQDAALLVSGVSPAEFSFVEEWEVYKRPLGYEAAKTAILNAFRSGKIPGTVVHETEEDINGTRFPIPDTVSLKSRVDVEGLRDWLRSRGQRSGFFFTVEPASPDYLDPRNPRYAPKLAAAVRAWQAVTDHPRQHPKQALMKWLREHAAEFGLTDEEGRPNESGIEDAAKVANWKPMGGAPKTTGG